MKFTYPEETIVTYNNVEYVAETHCGQIRKPTEEELKTK